MTHHTLARRVGAAVIALGLVFGAAACSDDDDADNPSTDDNGVDLGEEIDELGEEIDEGVDELDEELDGDGG